MTGRASPVTATVTVNGQPINVTRLEVCLTKTKKSETFRATVAMYDPAAQGLDQAAGSNVTVSINGQQIGGTFILEHPEYDFGETRIEISGRDAASSQLIDTQNTQTFTNQQPNQVVQQLAGNVPVDMDTVSQDAGKIYQLDYNAITHRGSAWSAILRLADINGMNAYVTGGTLYWKSIDEQLPSYQIQWSPPSARGYATSNVLRLRCHKNGQMGKEINVTSKSHNHKAKKTLSASATAGGSVPGNLDYNYVIAGATQDQLQNFSTKKSREHAKHAFDIDVEIPGDLTVTPRMSLQLSGTGTSFDTQYDVQDVKHEAEWGAGFVTHVTGKTSGSGSS